MRFSEAFSITRNRSDDWFDPHLTVDTRLLVDPLLIFLDSRRFWAGSHDELIGHFAHCFTLIASGGTSTSPQARMAKRLLIFPEPPEFGLGYTASGTAGAGSAGRFAQTMVDGIAVAIAAGLQRPRHIEEVGLLSLGIGADRISDAACWLSK